MQSRETGLKAYHHIYKSLNYVDRADRNICFYCGEPASCFDHHPPITQFETALNTNKSFEALLIPSCTECNSLLGAYFSLTLFERFQKLKEKLEQKYKKHIRAAQNWQEWEIDELEGNLCAMIRSSISTGEIAIERIAYQGHSLVEGEEIKKDSEYILCAKCGYILESTNDYCTKCGTGDFK